MNPDATAPLALLISRPKTSTETWSRAPFERWTFTAQPVRMIDGSPRNPSDRDPLEDLTINAAMSSDMTDDAGRPRPYGLETEYRSPYSVDLRRAELMTKTLGRLAAWNEKTDRARGYAETLSEYVLRQAEALGVKSFLVYPQDPADDTGWHTTTPYQPLDGAQARHYIDSLVKDWITAHTAQEATT